MFNFTHETGISIQAKRNWLEAFNADPINFFLEMFSIISAVFYARAPKLVDQKYEVDVVSQWDFAKISWANPATES